MAEKTSKKETAEKAETEKPTCGIVMPISAMDTYTAEHWTDIKNILLDVIESAGFTGSLVSDSEETSVIQKTIVQNVYNNDIVICDISGKNANVMFELGLRLAFDKATIVIKDFDTGFSFDTSPIEHLLYPRDLRFQAIIEFKEKLKAKILATYKKSKSDPNYSTFLKSFGEFKIAHLESKEVSADEFIINELKEIKNTVQKLSSQTNFEMNNINNKFSNASDLVIGLTFLISSLEEGDKIVSFLDKYNPGLYFVFNIEDEGNGIYVNIDFEIPIEYSIAVNIVHKIMPRIKFNDVKYVLRSEKHSFKR